MFEGFETFEVDVPGARIAGRRGGEGPPVLLLHGYPQTGAMWHQVAAALADDGRTVVVPDLRGYGASRAHDGDHTFRAMAADQVALMAGLGFASFDVLAHDRGARTAHRMALDSPGVVRALALLDILPTLDVWRLLDDWLALRYFHWTFLPQPGGMPQRLVAADPDAWLDHAFGALGGSEYMHPDAMAEYRAAGRRPEVSSAWCADYAAAAGPDLDHDRADVGRTLPHRTLVLWGSRGVVGAQVDPLDAWRAWFPGVTGEAVDAGHFLVEERPDVVLPMLRAFLRGSALGG